jgi:alpha-D-ribose 1-methylphosphonate 5-triphosphate diphosphatase PhnM
MLTAFRALRSVTKKPAQSLTKGKISVGRLNRLQQISHKHGVVVTTECARTGGKYP